MEMPHSCTSDEELNKNLVLSHVEVKVDVLMKMVEKGDSEILKTMAKNKDWGSMKVFGRTW